MIRSSSYSLKEGNATKLHLLKTFRHEYAEAVIKFIDFLWETRIECGKYVLDVRQGLYSCPSMLPNVPKIDSRLSGRSLKCAATQACGIVGSVLRKRFKQEKKLEYCRAKGFSTKKLEETLKEPPTKPLVKTLNPELNSIIVNFGESKNKFDLWLNFKALFKDLKGLKIAIPLKSHRHSNKISSESIGRKASILLGEKSIDIRYELPEVPLKSSGETISIDQGVIDLISTNRKDQIAIDNHGWTLIAILKKMAKCKLGSVNFAKAKSHLKNYINFVMKRLDLKDVKEVKFEDIFNINFGANVSRILKHWSNPLIRDSLMKVCESKGVLFTPVPNEFNSQRCNKCGWTQKANRKGKVFSCQHCGMHEDADHNASLNILIRDTLPHIPFGFRNLKHNIKGFFWNLNILCDKFGEDLTVPQPPKT
jgi:transposase